MARRGSVAEDVDFQQASAYSICGLRHIPSEACTPRSPGLDTAVGTLEREAELLRALAHPTRLALLEELSQDEECVCHLSHLLVRPQPYISKQLAELREAGLVVDRREGNRIYYRLADPRIATLLETARALARREARRGRHNVAGCPCPRCA